VTIHNANDRVVSTKDLFGCVCLVAVFVMWLFDAQAHWPDQAGLGGAEL